MADLPVPYRSRDGRLVVRQKISDAVASIGGMCMEFVIEPETWPVFYSWLCQQVPGFRGQSSESVRADVRRVLGMLPPKQDLLDGGPST